MVAALFPAYITAELLVVINQLLFLILFLPFITVPQFQAGKTLNLSLP